MHHERAKEGRIYKKPGSTDIPQILEVCYKSGVTVVTIYAFSIENFKRPKFEVDALMEILKIRLMEVCQHGDLLDRYGASLRILGRRNLVRPDVQAVVDKAVDMTKHNNRYSPLPPPTRILTNTPTCSAILNVCFPYTSRDEMATAVRSLVSLSTSTAPAPASPPLNDNAATASTSSTDDDDASDASDATATPGLSDFESITEQTITEQLFTAGCPPVDLLVRTSGVRRLSDFMLWQSHKDTDIVFADTLWPQFDIWTFLPILIDWGVRRKRAERARESRKVQST